MGDQQDSRVENLRAIPLFSGMSDESLQRILDSASEVDLSPGHVLIQPGMPGSGLFVIEEGEVTVELPGRQAELGPGEFVGDLALLTDHPHTGRVRAKTPVKALAINREDFGSLLNAEPKMALSMLEALAQRLAGAP
ncbi:MAG: Crp/Fnr family transcriptional regulator [Actinomycetota bacterium]